jgi:hypothetical protein
MYIYVTIDVGIQNCLYTKLQKKNEYEFMIG